MALVEYNELRFMEQMAAALKSLQTVLHRTKHAELIESVPHQYTDKYTAVERLTNTMSAAVLNALFAIGLDTQMLQTLYRWNKDHEVTLRFHASEKCCFVKKTTYDVESPRRVEVETTSSRGASRKEVIRVIEKVTEYEWKFDSSFTLTAHPGTNVTEAVTLLKRKGTIPIITESEAPPRPQAVSLPFLDCSLSPLLDLLAETLHPRFCIQRDDPACYTPRRNKQVERILRFGREVFLWSQKVFSYFRSDLFPVDTKSSLDMSILSADLVFNPIIPVALSGSESLIQDQKEDKAPPPAAGVVVLPPDTPLEATSIFPSSTDLNQCLAEQHRTLHAALETLAGVWPAGDSPGQSRRGSGLATVQEGRLCLVALHVQALCGRYRGAVDYIEDLLRRQLIAAVGREITPKDLAEYLEGHYRRLFRHAARPGLLSFAVRRPHHAPEGIFSVEVQEHDAIAKPIMAFTRVYDVPEQPMYLAIDAATRVEFRGVHHVHAFLCHKFSRQPSPRLQLVARARQFSCFVLLVGRMQSRDVFDPTYACLVQNLDDLRIPLDLEEIPAPQEFRDAIESLSPEQQRFAKAIRAMQLEGTLFAVCVLQVKPQLERLLRMPLGALTKELQLTQDLMDLFLQYQVPSDLLTTCEEGETPPPAPEAVARVKGHVRALQEMLAQAKERELQEEEQKKQKKLLEEPPRVIEVDMLPTSVPRSVAGRRSRMVGTPAPPSPADMPLHMMCRTLPDTDARCGRAAPIDGAAWPLSTTTAAPPPPTGQPAAAAPAGNGRPGDTAKQSDPSHVLPEDSARNTPEEAGEDAMVDYTSIPAQLDRQYEALDVRGAVRPTILKPGGPWRRRRQAGLLSEMHTASLGAEEQKAERNKAMDLLDALSRSGALPMANAELHLFVAATHCFDKTLLETVVQDNLNPIAHMERSALAIAATVHGRPPAALVAPAEAPRLQLGAPESPP